MFNNDWNLLLGHDDNFQTSLWISKNVFYVCYLYLPEPQDSPVQYTSEGCKAQLLHLGIDSSWYLAAIPKSRLHSRRLVYVPLPKFASTHQAHTTFEPGIQTEVSQIISQRPPVVASGPLPTPFSRLNRKRLHVNWL